MGNDPDYEATQKARRDRLRSKRHDGEASAPCINCGKPRCDGHDGDSWKRCAQRYHAWAIQADKRACDVLRQHGIDPTLLALRGPA